MKLTALLLTAIICGVFAAEDPSESNTPGPSKTPWVRPTRVKPSHIRTYVRPSRTPKPKHTKTPEATPTDA